MANVSIKSYQTFKGPWLLDGAQLKELDGELALVWKDLDAKVKEELAAEVELKWNEAVERAERRRRSDSQPAMLPDREQLAAEVAERYTFSRATREVKVDLSSRETLVSETIDGLRGARELKHAEVSGMAVRLRRGTSDLTLTIENNELRLHFHPETDSALQSACGRLLDWVEKNKPRPAQVWWREWSTLAWLGLFMGYFVLALAATSSGRSAWREEARAILAEGIGDANRDRAIEVLLGLTARMEPTGAGTGDIAVEAGTLVLLFAPVLLLAMLSIAPSRAHLALGPHGTRRVERWKCYTRWTFRSAPAWVVLTLAGAALQALVF